MPDTWVVVSEIRNCDMCRQDPPAPAYADGKMVSGPWANMCKDCFEIYGVGLGLGMGQELLLEPPSTTTMADTEPPKAKFQEVEHFTFAEVKWSIGDVKTLRPDWEDWYCYNFLVDNGKYVQEAMVLAGWEAMRELINEEEDALR